MDSVKLLIGTVLVLALTVGVFLLHIHANNTKDKSLKILVGIIVVAFVLFAIISSLKAS